MGGPSPYEVAADAFKRIAEFKRACAVPPPQEVLRQRDPWGGPWWSPQRCEHVVRLSLVSDAVECVKCARVWRHDDLYNLTEES